MANNSISEIQKMLSSIEGNSFIAAMRLQDMETKKAYRIIKAERRTTKYGDRISLMFEGGKIFLPERFNTIPDNTLTYINSDGNFFVVNQGPVGKSFNIQISHQEDPSNYITPNFYCSSSSYVDN